MLVFEERRKPEYPEKNLSEQRREPTNSTHIWRRVRESNPGHIQHTNNKVWRASKSIKSNTYNKEREKLFEQSIFVGKETGILFCPLMERAKNANANGIFVSLTFKAVLAERTDAIVMVLRTRSHHVAHTAPNAKQVTSILILRERKFVSIRIKAGSIHHFQQTANSRIDTSSMVTIKKRLVYNY